MVVPLAVYHTAEADMVTNHQPTEATNPFKDLPI